MEKTLTANKETVAKKVNGFFIQPKLTINNPNDVYEKEADAMADKVMRMEQPFIQAKPIPVTPVQRKCTHCDEEEKKAQRKEMNSEETTADSNLESYVGSLSGSGQPLQNEVRNFYEPRFGYNFSNVKVHTDSIAAKSAQSINALAYTSGNNVVFNSGQYAPDTDSGKRLLGHELTHVVQQGAGVDSVVNPVQRTPTINIADENFIGPLQAKQRRAAASCPIHCNGTNAGTLHSMGLFYHQSRSGIRNTPTSSDNGVGTALHFIANSSRFGCQCDDFQIIQVITTTHPAAGRSAGGYIDNNAGSTPFYSDYYLGGTGEHAIPNGYTDAGETVDTTTSIYDRPYRSTSGVSTTIEWKAEACVACVRNTGPDLILGGVSYGFRLPYNTTTGSFDTIEGIGPDCMSYASSNFIRVLGSDPTISGYDFTVEYGPGDFPAADPDKRYA